MTPMRAALDEARAAARRGEVPVGALVLDENGRVLARAGNDAQPRQCHVLPGLRFAALIFDEAAQLRGERPLASRRTQPHVDRV